MVSSKRNDKVLRSNVRWMTSLIRHKSSFLYGEWGGWGEVLRGSVGGGVPFERNVDAQAKSSRAK